MKSMLQLVDSPTLVGALIAIANWFANVALCTDDHVLTMFLDVPQGGCGSLKFLISSSSFHARCINLFSLLNGLVVFMHELACQY